MNPVVRGYCNLALLDIQIGNYGEAIDWLRYALRRTTDRKVWSHLMRALRALRQIAEQ